VSTPIAQSATTWVGQTLGLVADKVAALAAAWQSGRPVSLAELLPTSEDSARQFALVELIKVDLEYRWRRNQPKRIEDYCEEHPDLLTPADIPVDLLVVEHQIRIENGNHVSAEEYRRRFPQHADNLSTLLEAKQAEWVTRPFNARAVTAGQAAADLKVGESIDDFDLMAVLGSGAFATVYLAWQRTMQRQVAIKVSASLNEEPQALARLDHPHIVRVHDLRPSADGRFRLLSMQPVPGGTLQAVIPRMRELPPEQRTGEVLLKVVDSQLDRQHHEPPMDSANRRRLAKLSWPEVVCQLGAQMAGALAYAHDQHVLHRDIKPANVLLTAEGCPKLADFNVSFSSEFQGTTAADCFGGSLAYMSPEQLHACHPRLPGTPADVDARSDVFSLGVVMWELLTGERPWEDASMRVSSLAVVEEFAKARQAGVVETAIAQLPDGMPAALGPLLLRCLDVDPERRPTAEELARRLVLCLDRPVQDVFHPQPTFWNRLLREWPLTAVIALAVLPNVLFSVLNISYNQQAVAEGLAPNLFNHQVVVVNLIAYLAGISLALAYGLPVIRAALFPAWLDSLSAQESSRLRARCLGLCDFVPRLSIGVWTCCGVVFPVWTHLALGRAELSSYSHYILSQVFCGALAGALSFFFVTHAVQRGLLPRLVEPGQPDAQTISGLERLGSRARFFFALQCAVPFLCVMLLAQSATPMRFAFLALGALGMAGLGVTLWLMKKIRRDAAALARALSPGTETVADPSLDESGHWQDALWSIASEESATNR